MKPSSELSVRVDARATVTALVYQAAQPALGASLILAHGAGAGQRSGFMTAFAGALAGRGVDTVTFDFLYTAQRRRIPDRRPALEACYRAVVDTAVRHVASAATSLFIGGKSMGGRIATHVAAAGLDRPVDGIVLLGYPLHPPGRPDERRDAHLPAVGCPMLFVQGARDTFGTPAELEPVLASLPIPAKLHVVTGGDHSFKVAKTDGRGQVEIFEEVQRVIADWIRGARSRSGG